MFEKLVGLAFNYDIKLALDYARRGVIFSEKIEDKNWQPQFYEMQGRMHANLLELDSATLFFNKAISGYTTVNNKKGQATTTFKIAWVHRKKGEIDKAMAADLKALSLMEHLGDQKGIANALGRVSSDLTIQGQLGEALKYAQKAIDICKNSDFRDELYYAFISAGDVCIADDKPALALEYYNKSLDLAHELKFGFASIADIINSRGNALKRLGRYNEALEDYYACLKNAKMANYPNAIAVAIANLGEINLLLGNYPEALFFQLKTIALQEKDGDFSNLVENYQHASTIYEHLGNFEPALEYQKKAFLLRDSTASVKSDVAISELRTQYETEKKETIITSQQAVISQQNLIKWLGLGLAAVLAFLALSFYRNLNIRKKANKLLTKKNAENELLLKEIHHRVKNNLEVVSSLLLLQSSQINDPNIKDAMQESQNRVHSIGIVHQKLYQGDNLAAIEMKDYFINLSESILDSFGMKQRVKIACVMEELEVDIDTAVPLGLIVNELLTNTLKYAFPEERNGAINIKLEQQQDVLHMEIADDGIGKSSLIKGTGFGSQLISLLTQQLNGTIREEVK
ncbi:MAG: histidine kinase dimerization/phosphoacceptor domain -containing protein, partial [Saprospiraceae bacterium]